MDIEEFSKTRFGAGDKMRKKSDGKIYDIVALDFDESLFAYWPDNESQETTWWIRCENVDFIPFDDSKG
jgi:hypothetical protein